VDGIGAYDATSNSFELLFAGELTGRTGMSPPYFRGAAAAGDGRVLLIPVTKPSNFTILDTRVGVLSFLDVSAGVGTEEFTFTTAVAVNASRIIMTSATLVDQMGVVDLVYSCGHDGDGPSLAFHGCLFDRRETFPLSTGIPGVAFDASAPDAAGEFSPPKSTYAFRTVPTDSAMMRSAALAGDSRVVFPPLGTSVGVYDPSTGNFTTTGSMSGYYSYYAGASALDGRVIFAPYDTGAVGIFDPAGNVQVTTIDFTSQLGCSSGCFSGAVTADDGRVVMSPYNSQNVGVFNPTTNELATIVDGLDSADVRKFWGAAKAGTGAIVFVPYDANAVGVFHPHNDSVTLLPIVVHDGDGNVVTAAKFEGGATAHDGRVIFAPRFVDGIGAYDATSNSFELLFAGELTGRTGMSPPYFRGAAAAGDGRVLLTGASSATVFTILDTRDGGSFSFLDVSAEVGPESFVSGKFSGAVTVSDFGTVNQKRLSQIFLTPSAINGEMGIVDVEYSCGEMVNKAFEGCFPPEACTPCQEKLKARGHNAVPQCYVQVS
jgi:hypothetical protein